MFRERNTDFQDYIRGLNCGFHTHESSSPYTLQNRAQIACNYAYEVPYYRYQSRHFLYIVGLCTFQECHDYNDT